MPVWFENQNVWHCTKDPVDIRWARLRMKLFKASFGIVSFGMAFRLFKWPFHCFESSDAFLHTATIETPLLQETDQLVGPGEMTRC